MGVEAGTPATTYQLDTSCIRVGEAHPRTHRYMVFKYLDQCNREIELLLIPSPLSFPFFLCGLLGCNHGFRRLSVSHHIEHLTAAHASGSPCIMPLGVYNARWIRVYLYIYGCKLLHTCGMFKGSDCSLLGEAAARPCRQLAASIALQLPFCAGSSEPPRASDAD